MRREVDVRRRWIGAGVLTVALAMLVLGQTALKGRLGELPFLLYWLVCFLFTFLAIVIAFLDARSLQQRVREEQRELFDATLKNIDAEARKGAPGATEGR